MERVLYHISVAGINIPTKAKCCRDEIPPTAVGGLFIRSLQGKQGWPFPQSHQPQLVDCSYPAYKESRADHFPIPPTAVGGLFICSLRRKEPRYFNRTNRSWWIVHMQPTRKGDPQFQIPPTSASQNERRPRFPKHCPTTIGGIQKNSAKPSRRLGMNHPPTAVGGIQTSSERTL